MALESLTVASVVPVSGDVGMLHRPLLLGGASLHGVTLSQSDGGQLGGAQLLIGLLGGGA